jgi:hypothetical protein
MDPSRTGGWTEIGRADSCRRRNGVLTGSCWALCVGPNGLFQNPPDLIFSVIKALSMATIIVLVGCYYGYTAKGGPVGVGAATARSMFLNIILVHIVGRLGTLAFWGANPRTPIGG